MLLRGQKRLGETEPLYREALNAKRKQYGTSAATTLNTLGNLANLLQEDNRPVEAEELLREEYAERRGKTGGLNDRDTLVAMHSLGRLVAVNGKPEEAESLLREAKAACEQYLGSGDSLVGDVSRALAQLLEQAGKNKAEAEQLRRQHGKEATRAKSRAPAPAVARAPSAAAPAFARAPSAAPAASSFKIKQGD